MTIPWTQASEFVTGHNHPAFPDVDNRPLRYVLSQSGYNPDAPFFGLPIPTKMYSSSAFPKGVTGVAATDNATSVNALIARCVADNVPVGWIDASRVPYDPTLVAYNSAVRLVREGGDPGKYDVVAYGGRQSNGSISGAMEIAASHAQLNGGGIVDVTGFPGAPFLLLDNDLAGLLSITSNAPITFLWGPFEYRVTHRQTAMAHHHHILFDSKFILKDGNGNRVLGVTMFVAPYIQTGFGGPGNGVICDGTNFFVVKSAPGAVNWAYLEPGQQMLIAGHVPRLGTDNTLTNANVLIGDTTITVVSTAGFMATFGTLRIENEIITYSGSTGTTFTGCVRGAMGSTATAHGNGVVVNRAVFDSYVVSSVSGNTIFLQAGKVPPVIGTNVTAYLGPMDIRFYGTGTFDGNLDPTTDDPNNPVAIQIEGGRKCFVGDGLKFQNFDHGGVFFRACTDCGVRGQYEVIGRIGLQLGSAVWFFQNCKGCDADVTVEYSYIAATVDDRTTSPDDLDNASEGCSVYVRKLRSCSVGITLEGTLRCDGRTGPFVDPVGSAITVRLTAPQWITNNPPTDNYVEAGLVLGPGVTTDIFVAPGVEVGNNTLRVMRRGGIVSISSTAGATVLQTPPELIALTYGATVNIDSSRSEEFLIPVTDGNAFTVANPTNVAHTRRLRLVIANQSGGALGAITFGSDFRLTAAFVAPANNNERWIDFMRQGTLWHEVGRTTADQAIT